MTQEKLLYTKDIARLMGGWPTHRARRFLKRHGVAEKDGRRYYTTRTMLRTTFPALYEEIMVELLIGETDE